MQKDGTEGLFSIHEKVQNKLKNKLFFPIMKRNKMDKKRKQLYRDDKRKDRYADGECNRCRKSNGAD